MGYCVECSTFHAGRCPKSKTCFSCGHGGFSITVPELVVRAFELIGPQYCSKCGYQFWSICSSCGGSGNLDGGYCSSCGRRKPSTKCYRCTGSGRLTSLLHHTCKSDPFPF